jgi:hypothetical protein
VEPQVQVEVQAQQVPQYLLFVSDRICGDQNRWFF